MSANSTSYQDFGRGKVYLRFENLPKAAGGPTLGPYSYVILSFERVRVGSYKVEVAGWHRGFWNISQDNSRVDRGDYLLEQRQQSINCSNWQPTLCSTFPGSERASCVLATRAKKSRGLLGVQHE
jgi:hypothetical protein